MHEANKPMHLANNPASNNAPLHVCMQAALDTTVAQATHRLTQLSDAVGVALMPDAHAAGDACVGTVLATRTRLYPSLIGGDLGCGIAVVRIDLGKKRFSPSLGEKLLAHLVALVPADRHAQPVPWTCHPNHASDPAIDKALATTGHKQLGTLGSGNHFLEIQSEHPVAANAQTLWAMVHTGSRGFGQAVADWHRPRANGSEHGLPFFDPNSPEGQAFLKDLKLARAYARLNRATIAQALAFACKQTLKARCRIVWDTDHNHIVRETHTVHHGPNATQQPLWIHRKGAAPAHAGQPVAIPGSMGTFSVHAIGRGHRQAFASSPHGAGRKLTRAQAKGHTTAQAMAQRMAGIVHHPKLCHRAKDEGPHAYKNLQTVLKDARPLVRVVRELRPLLVHKGM